MLKMMKDHRRCLILALAVLFVSALMAQQPPDVPVAPVPTQILDGKKAFISNGESTGHTGIPDLTYNEFYAAMKEWGRYELVPTPSEADVVLEVRFTAADRSETHEDVRLVILDPKTHITLWSFFEEVHPAARTATERKNFDEAVSTLVADLKKLVAPVAALGDARKK
jgi:hypothetical protein